MILDTFNALRLKNQVWGISFFFFLTGVCSYAAKMRVHEFKDRKASKNAERPLLSSIVFCKSKANFKTKFGSQDEIQNLAKCFNWSLVKTN